MNQERRVSLSSNFTVIERPKDLSKKLDEWIPRSIALAKALNTPSLADDLQKVGERLKFPGFRLAVVGNIGSGKSTFINRLLELPSKLPTGWLPTTTSITSITAGKREQMMIHFPSGRKELRPLSDTSWNDLIGGNTERLNTLEPLKVFLTIDNEWLKEIDIEIIDTPGIDGLRGSRAILISNLLSQCDAVVMLVNAVYPFSLTEAAFIEQAIIGQRIPCILVVVSKLDMLSEQGFSRQELFQQFKLIQDRVAKIATLILVISSQSLSENETESEIIVALRTQIEIIISKSDRKAWRSQQLASLVADHLEQMIEIGQSVLATRRMDKTKREDVRRKLDNERQKNAVKWEEITNEFIQRRQRIEQKLRVRLSDSRDKLIDQAASQLVKAPNPKLWWETELPFLAHHVFLSLARRSESLLINSLTSDVKWLEEQVMRRFITKLETTQAALGKSIEPILDQRELHLRDFERLNLFMKLGYGASSIIAQLLLSHIGFVNGNTEEFLKLGGIVASDRTTENINRSLLGTKIEEQRLLVDRAMRQSIVRSIEDYSTLILIRVAELYEHVVQDIQRQQTLWDYARMTALEQSEGTDERAYQKLIDNAVSLKSSIISF